MPESFGVYLLGLSILVDFRDLLCILSILILRAAVLASRREFCNPARGNEKGGGEEEGDCFRRNHLVPLPAARDLDHLNELLLAGVKKKNSG